MKRSLLILSIASLAIATSSNAQINKGATLIGGNIGGSTSKTDRPNQDEGNASGFNVGLRIGKAVKENLIIGGLASYSRAKEKNVSPYDYTNNLFEAGIFARKYKQIASSSFYIFATGTLTGGFEKRDNSYSGISSPQESKLTRVDLGLTPGVSYGVNKWLHIEAGFNDLLRLGYSSERTESAGALVEKRKSFSGNANISSQNQLYLGFTLLLN